MSKIDAYKTLTSMALACQNEETAKKTGYIFAIKDPEDKKRSTVVTCYVSGDGIILFQAITKEFAKMIKASVKPGRENKAFEIVLERIQREALSAMADVFPEETVQFISKHINELTKSLEEEF